ASLVAEPPLEQPAPRTERDASPPANGAAIERKILRRQVRRLADADVARVEIGAQRTLRRDVEIEAAAEIDVPLVGDVVREIRIRGGALGVARERRRATAERRRGARIRAQALGTQRAQAERGRDPQPPGGDDRRLVVGALKVVAVVPAFRGDARVQLEVADSNPDTLADSSISEPSLLRVRGARTGEGERGRK